MSGVTLKGTIRRRTTGRRVQAKVELPVPAEPQPDPKRKTGGPSRLARQLALAYWIEQRIEDGDLSDYAQAARVIGVSRARVSQILDLLLLPVALQEDVMLGLVIVSERDLRRGGPARPVSR